jgi:hypothetical protein
MFRDYPTFAKISLSTSEKILATGTTLPLYKFSITANPATGNGVGAHVFNIYIATSSASSVGGTTTVTNLKIYAYTDSSFSTPIGGNWVSGKIYDLTDCVVSNSGGGLVSGSDTVATTSVSTTATVLQIPAGQTYYFKVTGDITFTSGTSPSGWVRTYVDGDAAYPIYATPALMGTANLTSTKKFIWSPNATTSAPVYNTDWTDGYYVPGLPSTGMDSEMVSR